MDEICRYQMYKQYLIPLFFNLRIAIIQSLANKNLFYRKIFDNIHTYFLHITKECFIQLNQNIISIGGV